MPERSAVIFDLDGTLTRPALDFDVIRAEIGGIDGPILEAMEHLAPTERNRAERILVDHERVAAEKAELYDGAVEVVTGLRGAGFPVAILTRNSRETVGTILRRFALSVDAIRTREDGAIKPAAEPVLAICRQLNAAPAASWMVGDFLFDILCGRAAGTRTILMIGDAPSPPFAEQADHVVRSLAEIPPIVT